MKKLFIDLKKEIYQLWENNLELSNFTKLPKDLIYNEVLPDYILPAKKLENWQSNSLKTIRVHNIINNFHHMLIGNKLMKKKMLVNLF